MENTNLTEKATIVPVVKEIRSILDTARSNVAQQVNSELLNTYWHIGRIICEYEQSIRWVDSPITFSLPDMCCIYRTRSS